MTVYGIDVASYQGNVNWSRVAKEGFDFAIVKCTQGTGYLNPYFVRQIDGAKAAGLLVAVYHYVEAGNPGGQAAFFASKCGTEWPVCLDTENGSGGEGTNYAIAEDLRKRGYTLLFNYFPEWYWRQVGSPRIRFGPLWKSWYPDMTPGYASAIYARCPASAWNGYGHQRVALRQFTSSARVAGQTVDASAFEGTRHQLAALFGGSEKEDDDMPTAQEVAKAVWSYDGIPCREPDQNNYLWWSSNALGTTVKYSRQALAQLAALQTAIEALANQPSSPVTADQLKTMINDAVAANVRITGTVEVTGAES